MKKIIKKYQDMLLAETEPTKKELLNNIIEDLEYIQSRIQGTIDEYWWLSDEFPEDGRVLKKVILGLESILEHDSRSPYAEKGRRITPEAPKQRREKGS